MHKKTAADGTDTTTMDEVTQDEQKKVYLSFTKMQKKKKKLDDQWKDSSGASTHILTDS